MDKGKFWKSLNDYNDRPEFIEAKKQEFREGVTDEFNVAEMDGISRRRFLALLSASAALTATACSDYQDKGEIVPYNQRPENILPGKANYYASTCDGCSQHCGILVKTREGRPIKIDGNPDHPVNKGKICATGHSNIMDLYDPERLKHPLYKERKIEWGKAIADVKNQLSNITASGKKIAVISKSVASPAIEKLFEEFKQFYPATTFYSYELFDSNNRLEAWKRVFDNEKIPSLKLDEAKIIVSIEDDFLARGSDSIELIRKFIAGRNVDDIDNFNRLYVVEGGLSLTGSNADYRIRLRPDAHYELLLAVYNELSKKFNRTSFYSSISLNDVVSKYSLDKTKVNYLIDDLYSNRDKAIVLGGDALSVDAHVVINLINVLLNENKLFDFESVKREKFTSGIADWNNLVKDMNSGMVGAVINFDADPVFHLPSEYGFNEALKNVELKVSLVGSRNDTSALCDYVLAINHTLESWGAFSRLEGLHSLMQPIINPIFDTKQKEEILLGLMGKEENFGAYLKSYYKSNVYPKLNLATSFDKFWFSSLHDGVFEEPKRGRYNYSVSNNIKLADPEPVKGSVVSLQPSYFIGDGKFANNGWLQETPHPVTKVTWDNFVAISPSTAMKLKVENDSVLEISNGKNRVKLPVMVQPGVAEDTFVVELGYGRKVVGDVGKDAGINANPLLSLHSGISKWIVNSVSVKAANETYKLASTQEHHALDDDFVKDFHKIRGIIIENSVEGYKKSPNFIEELPHENLPSITRTFEYKDVKWGMSIDLNKCIGCAICVSSCNVENNVPVVGKDQVAVGREMQWMRIDRYYSGTPDEPEVSNQPMLCQHCDSAPCENVCPVNATNHSPDGLNQMVYNRCVGTRYCANNCPYKVRRFNFFNFRDHFADAYYENELTALANNPEVTVRSRGVMEKCTFCVQRIMEARSEAIAEGKTFNGAGVKTACQEACPSEAIVFGNYNDKSTEIAEKREHELGYHVLHELNVRPNVTYLAKLRNTRSEEV